MELSCVYTTALKPWFPNIRSASVLNPSSLCYNENVSHTMEFNNFGSSCANCLALIQCHGLSYWKQHNIMTLGARNLEAKLRRSPIKFKRTSSLASLQACKATSDERRAVTGESILMNEQTLEKELRIAIEQENYSEAARIRDRIAALQKDSEASVLAANARFYNAFRAGDLASMEGLWAKGDNVCVVHPGAGGISGYDLVISSWEYVLVDYEFPLDIEIKDVRVNVKGDVGYVTCMELVKTKGGNSWGRQFATNVFEKVDGQWLISIHHASPVDL